MAFSININQLKKWKNKKTIIFFSVILLIVVTYILVYNKSYHIKVRINDIYEIQIQTSNEDGYGLKTETIKNEDKIKDFIKEAQKLKFTHPTYHTGKGWETAITIKMRDKDNINTEYKYTLLKDYINIGLFRYKIISY